MTVLGKTSLKDADRWKLETGETTAFELLEYIFVIRNNVTHRGVREFTPESLNTRRYRSDYLERHVAVAGIPISEAVVVSLIATAKEIVRWMRGTNAP
jgi:hypothetical protein